MTFWNLPINCSTPLIFRSLRNKFHLTLLPRIISCNIPRHDYLFHSSPFPRSNSPNSRVKQTRRRRRGKGQSSLPSQSTKTESGMDDEERRFANRPESIIKDGPTFLHAVNEFLVCAEQALKPMKVCNDVFDVQLFTTKDGPCLTIILKPGDGMYTIQSYLDSSTCVLNSPVSGNNNYVLCGQTGKFVGMDDGHLLEGMLVRDLIRQCNGFPSF